MGLIVAQEEKLPITINGEIESVRDSLNAYNTLEKSLDSDLNDIVNKTEQDIMAIKRQTFLRDLQDYQNNQVFIYTNVWIDLIQYSEIEDAGDLRHRGMLISHRNNWIHNRKSQMPQMEDHPLHLVVQHDLFFLGTLIMALHQKTAQEHQATKKKTKEKHGEDDWATTRPRQARNKRN